VATSCTTAGIAGRRRHHHRARDARRRGGHGRGYGGRPPPRSLRGVRWLPFRRIQWSLRLPGHSEAATRCKSMWRRQQPWNPCIAIPLWGCGVCCSPIARTSTRWRVCFLADLAFAEPLRPGLVFTRTIPPRLMVAGQQDGGWTLTRITVEEHNQQLAVDAMSIGTAGLRSTSRGLVALDLLLVELPKSMSINPIGIDNKCSER
jgi:hypothetical protein